MEVCEEEEGRKEFGGFIYVFHRAKRFWVSLGHREREAVVMITSITCSQSSPREDATYWWLWYF